jgi:hypothetical protein
MVDDNTKPNGNIKAFGGVFVLIAVITGMWAMIEPLSQRLDFITAETKSLRKVIEQHNSKYFTHISDGHPRRVEQRVEVHEERLDKIEGRRWSEEDRPQWERIRAIEREIYSNNITCSQLGPGTQQITEQSK